MITEFCIDRHSFTLLTSDGNGDGNGNEEPAAEDGNSTVKPSKYAFLIPFFSFFHQLSIDPMLLHVRQSVI